MGHDMLSVNRWLTSETAVDCLVSKTEVVANQVGTRSKDGIKPGPRTADVSTLLLTQRNAAELQPVVDLGLLEVRGAVEGHV